jgi:hypothetical protein
LTKVGAGTLTVANLGPTLQVGDKFTLFSQPLNRWQCRDRHGRKRDLGQ